MFILKCSCRTVALQKEIFEWTMVTHPHLAAVLQLIEFVIDYFMPDLEVDVRFPLIQPDTDTL